MRVFILDPYLHISTEQKARWMGTKTLRMWGWCPGMTQRDGTGREVGRGFRMWNTCTPMADSC